MEFPQKIETKTIFFFFFDTHIDTHCNNATEAGDLENIFFNTRTLGCLSASRRVAYVKMMYMYMSISDIFGNRIPNEMFFKSA